MAVALDPLAPQNRLVRAPDSIPETRDEAIEQSPESRAGGSAFALITALFFLWGFLTSLNNILVPHFKDVFALGYGGSALVNLAFFSAYFLFSIPAGKIIGRIGYQRGIVLGLGVSAVGALLFFPAASIPSYPFFLAGLFILAAGITVLQVAANPYVAALGRPETAPSRLNLTQAFNSLGTTLAPYMGGALFLSALAGADRLAAARAVRLPYLFIAVVLAALAAVFWRAKLPAVPGQEKVGADRTFLDALRVPRLRLGVVAIFLYVGAEVTIGSFLVDLLASPAIAGMRLATAARWVSLYWAGAMIGRFAGAALLHKRDAGKILGAAGLAAALLVALSVSTVGPGAGLGLVVVGLFNSIMFPTIFTLAIAGLGDLVSRGSSLLVMAIVGGAVVPVLVGALADTTGLHHAMALLLPCYLFIAYYGYRGARRGGGAGEKSARVA
jgi:FHS family L-fucose permease-like MFS transporter